MNLAGMDVEVDAVDRPGPTEALRDTPQRQHRLARGLAGGDVRPCGPCVHATASRARSDPCRIPRIWTLIRVTEFARLTIPNIARLSTIFCWARSGWLDLWLVCR